MSFAMNSVPWLQSCDISGNVSPNEKLAEEGVSAFLESLVANRLMVTDGRNWLSLAVRVRDIQCGNVADCVVGPTVVRNAENHRHITKRIFNTR